VVGPAAAVRLDQGCDGLERQPDNTIGQAQRKFLSVESMHETRMHNVDNWLCGVFRRAAYLSSSFAAFPLADIICVTTMLTPTSTRIPAHPAIAAASAASNPWKCGLHE
jgi:hypothetical protein